VFGKRLMMGTSSVVFRLLGFVFGRDFLDDLSKFFQDFSGLYAGFRERHEAVLALFQSTDTSFVTVCAPTESSLDVATFFQEELVRRELNRGGLVVNQVHHCEGETHDAGAVLGALAEQLSDDLSERTAASLLARLGMAHKRLRALMVAEDEMTERVRRAATGGGWYQEIPRLDGNVHDLSALHAVSQALFRPAHTL
jgi:anion-transporting  ArsA/GET3 family ATPase